MVLGEKSLLSVFRRRNNSRRDLNQECKEDCPKETENDGPVEETNEEGLEAQYDGDKDNKAVPEADGTDTSVETSCTIVERTTSFYDGQFDTTDDEVPDKPQGVLEGTKDTLEVLSKDTGKDSESVSTVGQSDRTSKSEATDGTAKDAEASAGAKPEEAMRPRDTKKLGWTPGRVKLVDKNRFVLEPMSAIGDALDDICLDEALVRAMAGKRGSFSSERSVKTDESEGSETKRARRAWSSVFRMRNGPPK